VPKRKKKKKRIKVEIDQGMEKRRFLSWDPSVWINGQGSTEARTSFEVSESTGCTDSIARKMGIYWTPVPRFELRQFQAFSTTYNKVGVCCSSDQCKLCYREGEEGRRERE
jgi:hypothetical protein